MSCCVLRGDSDSLDYDHRVRRGQGRNLDDRVGWIRRGEPLASQLDDLREVGHRREEDRDLDDAIQTGATGRQRALQIAKCLVGLTTKVTVANKCSIVAIPRLTGNKQKA